MNPGATITIDLAKMNGLQKSFYQSPPRTSKTPTSDIGTTLASQICLESQGDVSGGILFSAGVDSSIVAAFSSLPCIFMSYRDASGSPGRGDDEDFLADVETYLGIDLTVTEFSSETQDGEAPRSDLDMQISAIAEGCEELIFDFTYLATFQICLEARRNGFKYVLSGMGGDEIFLGYPRHRLFTAARCIPFIKTLAPLIREVASFFSLQRKSKKLDRFFSFINERDPLLAYLHLMGFFSREEVLEMMLRDSGSDWVSCLVESIDTKKVTGKGGWLREVDRHTYLSRNLMVSDKASMNASVEMRVPFVSRAVWSESEKIVENKSESLVGKAALKKVLRKFLPRRLVYRKKVGFNPPMDGLLLAFGESSLRSYFSKGRLHQHLSEKEVAQIISDHFTGAKNNTYKLMQLMHLNAWLDLDYVDNKA